MFFVSREKVGLIGAKSINIRVIANVATPIDVQSKQSVTISPIVGDRFVAENAPRDDTCPTISC